MTEEELHAELDTFTFADWHIYVIVHEMIDRGQVMTLKCQDPTCRRDVHAFAHSGSRGQSDLLTLDHIVLRRSGGAHALSNLRVVHAGRNYGWRVGLRFVDDETKKRNLDRQHEERFAKMTERCRKNSLVQRGVLVPNRWTHRKDGRG